MKAIDAINKLPQSGFNADEGYYSTRICAHPGCLHSMFRASLCTRHYKAARDIIEKAARVFQAKERVDRNK